MAQPITHIVGGALVAQTAITHAYVSYDNTFTGILILYALGIIGAFAPDSVMVPEFLTDKLRGKQAMTDQGEWVLEVTDLSHSLPIWLGVSFVCWFYWFSLPENTYVSMTFLAVYSALMVGVFPDVPTHSEKRFEVTDCTFLYPYNELCNRLFGFSKIRWPHEKWEYRFNHGVIWPLNFRSLKPWEVHLNELFISMIVLQFCLY